MEELDLFSYKNTPKPPAEEAPQPTERTTPAPFPAQPVPPAQPQPPKLPGRESGFTFNPKAVNRTLVVSIHDVSPITREATARMLCELAEMGVPRVSLLVIPDHHHKGNLVDDLEFCAWLRECAAAGHEVVIHGYYHRRDQKAGETFLQKLATQYYTAGEGEFYDMSGADALRIISQARKEFRNVGLDPQGFVAPAWLLSEGADRALQRLGIAYTTRLGGVFDYTTGVNYLSQSLVWSTRSGWRRMLSRFWNAHLFRRLQERPLLRIGIHPPDIQHRAVWQQIKRLTARALETRTPKTYAEYLKRG